MRMSIAGEKASLGACVQFSVPVIHGILTLITVGLCLHLRYIFVFAPKGNWLSAIQTFGLAGFQLFTYLSISFNEILQRSLTNDL